MVRRLALIVCFTALPGIVTAQDFTLATPDSALIAQPMPTVTVSLDRALSQASEHSPAFRQALNDAAPADWRVRSAYAAFLPTADVSTGFGYTGAGSSQFGGTTFNQTSPSLNSNYQLGLSWRLSGATLTGPGQAKANRRATEADINSAESQLTFDITDQYLATLQASAQAEAARQQILRNTDFLRLAQAKYQVGQSTLLDVRQAEVQVGRSEVALLQARQRESESKLELFRRMGVVPPAPVQLVALSDSFTVVPPSFNREAILQLAEEQNPVLRTLRARESVAGYAVTAAKSAYFPTLSANAGWSGFSQEFTDEQLLLDQQLGGAQAAAAQCDVDNQIRAGLTTPLPPLNCNAAFTNSGRTQLDPSISGALVNSNDVFPFEYQSQPFRVNFTISLPLFTGFDRPLQVSEAQAAEEDAEEEVRAQALRVRALVEGRLLELQTTYRAIGVQNASLASARDQLRLAQDRYRLGSGTSLELADAQQALALAETEYINAVYDYHRAIAALEAVVGRPLR